MSSPSAVWRPAVTEILRERLGAGDSVWLPVRGRSMRPLLSAGARIFVAPPDRVRFGDLLAYETDGGTLVCHRVIGWRGAALLTRADHQGAGPEVVRRSQIVGVVADVKYWPVNEPVGPDFYTSYQQFVWPSSMYIIKVADGAAVLPAIRRAVEEIDPVVFDEIFHLNVLGPIVAMQTVIPLMRTQGGGSIVNVNSGTAFMTVPQYSVYSSSKRALLGFSLTARA